MAAVSVENMERQILTIVASSQPYEVKKTLIQYCCKQSLQPMEKEAGSAILKLAVQWMIYGSEALLVESGRMILMSWAQNKTAALVSFFDEAMLSSLIATENRGALLGLLDILTCVFPYLKSSYYYLRLCEVIAQHIAAWVKMNDSVGYCGSLCEFLTTNTDCLPGDKEELLRINRLLIQCLGKSKIPNASKDEMVEYFKKVCSICELLQVIWKTDSCNNFVVLSVKECFEMLSYPEYSSTVALAQLTSHVPDDVINRMTYDVTVSCNVPDQKLSDGISKMFHWLVWPKKTKVVQWLLMFFRWLVVAGKRNVLENIICSQILQVLSRVFMPVVRESNFVILVNMLMNFLQSPRAFHMLIPFVPSLMDRLRSEKSERSANFLNALGELIYTMMYRFPGHESLYEPLLCAMKDITRPSNDTMNKWLQSASIVAAADHNTTGSPRSFSSIMVPSSKGSKKTGLVNLGNTCYMNSILQCLFMLDVFRSLLMSRRVSPTRRPITYSLQDIFLFLAMSKREAVAPQNFVRQSRPPWFPSRTQQDCCEFVQYMMDKLEEEDKSSLEEEGEPSNTTNIIENFKGILCVTYTCLTCGNESKHKEAFTDILLAFPDRYCPDDGNVDSSSGSKAARPVNDVYENPKSLKGGDQIRKFQETVLSEDCFESAKESVPNVENTSKTKAHKNVSINPATRRDSERSTFTVQEMLEYFMKPEKLSGNNQYFCEQCRENVDGERRVQIGELPKYLMLALKRFSFDIKTQTKPKLLHIVQYPEELMFSSTAGEGIKLRQKDLAGHEELDVLMKEEWNDCAMDSSELLYSYKLCSVVVHSGLTCEAGHYYSYALDAGNGSCAGNDMRQWYCFNDEHTYETSYKEFMEREKTMLTDTTYILIYDKLEGSGQDDGKPSCESAPPDEMVERVHQDNIKYFQEKFRQSVLPEKKEAGRPRFDDNDKDDSSPPPGNCGSGGSNFSIPGNRFIF